MQISATAQNNSIFAGWQINGGYPTECFLNSTFNSDPTKREDPTKICKIGTDSDTINLTAVFKAPVTANFSVKSALYDQGSIWVDEASGGGSGQLWYKINDEAPYNATDGKTGVQILRGATLNVDATADTATSVFAGWNITGHTYTTCIASTAFVGISPPKSCVISTDTNGPIDIEAVFVPKQ